MNSLSKLSLRTLFLLILSLLLFPALAFGLTGFFRANAQSNDLEQVRLEVDSINQMINQSVGAPFYLSPRIYDPCNPESLKMVAYPDDWQIEYQYAGHLGDGSITCKWIYIRNGEMIAIDGWKDYDRKLASREYYRAGTYLLARDDFYILDDYNRVKCVKQRSYTDFDEIECYSEAGGLISIDPVNLPFSPIPPMLYWFSYR
jgi:hypothetical protein